MFPEIARDDVFRIETRRLWLRWPRMADATAIARLAGDKQVAEMTANIPHPYPVSSAQDFVLFARQGNAEGTQMTFAMAPMQRPGDILGMLGVEFRGKDDPEIGYWLGLQHWGYGFATEAVQAVIDVVFGITEAKGVTACARVTNPASRRVLEKCGFVFQGSGLNEAPARGGPTPVDFFRLDKVTWRSLKGWREPRLEHRAPAAIVAAGSGDPCLNEASL